MDFKLWLKQISESKSPIKKVIGVILFILGFLALITPLTPGSWLIFVGLELLGFRLAIWEKIKLYLMTTKPIGKYLSIIALVILAVGFILFFYKNKTTTPIGNQNPISNQTPSDPNNTSYTVEGKTVTLKNGEAVTKIDAGSASTIQTKIFEANAVGDVNGDGLNDTAVILTQNQGGSGTFFYAAVAIKTASGYQGSNAVLLGDRIAPQPTEIKNGLIIANFADRKSGESFSVSPSVGKSVYLEFFKDTLLARPESVQVSSPYPYQEITSPIVIKGQARGMWFFEASFPILLTDWDGKIIAQGVAQAKPLNVGDWMTENFVPFEATLTFTKPLVKNSGSLIFKKDNPSGLPQNDAAYEMPVIFK